MTVAARAVFGSAVLLVAMGGNPAVARQGPPSRGGLPSLRARLEALDRGPEPGPARTAWASAALVGAPYRSSPLGEGVLPDSDPRFSLEAFDCTTLVETAIALGHAQNVDEARALLDDVRYDGAPAYAARNHYVEAQWLPVAVRKGWLVDETRTVAGPLAEEAVISHTRTSWRAAARAGRLVRGLDPAVLPVGEFRVPLIPMGRALPFASRIPSGTVALVVRAERPGRPYRVTHMGIVVVDDGGRRVIRHASTSEMRVVDEPLARFLARLSRQTGWPVSGVSLWAVRDNRDRARALLTPTPWPSAIAIAFHEASTPTRRPDGTCRAAAPVAKDDPPWLAGQPASGGGGGPPWLDEGSRSSSAARFATGGHPGSPAGSG